MKRRISNLQNSDGFTLIELLVYLMFAVVILAIVGGILINSVRAESQVRGSAEAVDGANLAAQSLGRGVRNASALEVLEPEPGLFVLRTRSIDSSDEGVWGCSAWALADDELRWTVSSAQITSLSAGDIESWTLLARGVDSAAGVSPFVLGADSRSVRLNLTIANGGGAPILLDATIVSRQPIPVTGEVTEPCF